MMKNERNTTYRNSTKRKTNIHLQTSTIQCRKTNKNIINKGEALNTATSVSSTVRTMNIYALLDYTDLWTVSQKCCFDRGLCVCVHVWLIYCHKKSRHFQTTLSEIILKLRTISMHWHLSFETIHNQQPDIQSFGSIFDCYFCYSLSDI